MGRTGPRGGASLVVLGLSFSLLLVTFAELVGNFAARLDTTPAEAFIADSMKAHDRSNYFPISLGSFPRNSAAQTDDGVLPEDADNRATVRLAIVSIDPANRTAAVRASVLLLSNVLHRVGVQLSPHAAVQPVVDRLSFVLPEDTDRALTLLMAACGPRLDDECTDVVHIPVPLRSLTFSRGAEGLASTPAFSTTLNLPLGDATPRSYPGDGYVLRLRAVLAVPPPLTIDGADAVDGNALPVSALVQPGDIVSGRQVVALVHNGAIEPPDVATINFYVFRLTSTKLYVYGMALAPLLFALLLVGLLRRRRGNGGNGGNGGSGGGWAQSADILVGLIAATLTLLPLRAVLVPDELKSEVVTRVDLLLAIQVAMLITVAALGRMQTGATPPPPGGGTPGLLHRGARILQHPLGTVIALVMVGVIVAVSPGLPWRRELGVTMGPRDVEHTIVLVLGVSIVALTSADRALAPLIRDRLHTWWVAWIRLIVLQGAAVGALLLSLFDLIDSSDTIDQPDWGMGLASIAALIAVALTTALTQSAEVTRGTPSGATRGWDVAAVAG